MISASKTATEPLKSSRTVTIVSDSESTSLSRARWHFLPVWLHRWYRYSVLRVFLSELRNLPHRIGYIRKISAAERLQGLAEVRAWMDGILDSGFQTDRRTGIQYMQHLSSRYPFLSIFDRLLLQEAWNAGWVSSAHEGTLRSQSDTALP
jgi:hypothetical protein